MHGPCRINLGLKLKLPSSLFIFHPGQATPQQSAKMFAVPGWSVAANSLKVETLTQSNGTLGTKSNKRKRSKPAAAGVPEDIVDSSNVADLYETMVEGKKPVKVDQSAKRQKKGNKKQIGKTDERQTEEPSERADNEPEVMAPKDKKNKKDKKKDKQSQDVPKDFNENKPSKSEPTKEVATAPAAVLPPAHPKLTPLQAAMRQKLVSARFRHLNETLYTRPSEESFNLFQESPEMFEEYHEGFRRQVKVWPENPVGSFLKDIRTRAKVRAPGRGKPAPPAGSGISKIALPRTAGTCIIADLGCGDAALSQSLQADKDKLKVKIHSYDLQAPHALIMKADIANLPLADGSVNVAVFCLALMGTNWIDFIEEAYRILHWKGELWVAEIKSRFGPVRNKNAPVHHSVGNRKKVAAKKGDGKELEEDLAVEVDGMDDRRRETDISAFVEVLRKRGFVLQGERNEAVDLSNKMFVKMHFTKSAAPTKGKGVKEAEPGKFDKKKMDRTPKRVLDNEDDDMEINEASVLKPCVYKIR